jgi:hypothetical protein
VAEPAVVPADVAERDRLPDPVAGGLEQVQGLLRVVEGVAVTALLPIHEVAAEWVQACPVGSPTAADSSRARRKWRCASSWRPRSA